VTDGLSKLLAKIEWMQPKKYLVSVFCFVPSLSSCHEKAKVALCVGRTHG